MPALPEPSGAQRGQASGGAGGPAAEPLSLGLEKRGCPTTRGPLGREPEPGGRRAGAGWRAAGQDSDTDTGKGRMDVQAQPGEEEDGQEGQAGGVEARSRVLPMTTVGPPPTQAPWPVLRPPGGVRGAAPAADLAEPTQRGRTRRPSRSYLLGSQSCEMQQ